MGYSQDKSAVKNKFSNSGMKKVNTTETPVKINRCASEDAYKILMATDPVYRAAREKFIKDADEWVAQHPNYQAKTTVIIPVVVHIIYKATAENISDARVAEQLAYTNADYAGTNPHSMGAFSTSLKANTNIQFCLATVDPSGAATTGITRTLTTKTSFNITGSTLNCNGYPERCASSGGCDAWDVTKYLNIWVCNAGGSLCGISEFPTSPNNVYYGTTINYTFFGHTSAQAPYNLGGTYTHESGHCLNLFHTWGDDNGACTGSDQVSDTPNSGNCNYGNIEAGTLSESPTSSTIHTSPYYETDGCTTTSPGVLYQDFMDYTDDIDYACFTPGQVTRMTATLAGADLALTTSASTHCSTTTSVPTVTTTTATAILATTATSGGNVTSDGGASVTVRGVCWATTANPVATGNHTSDGTGTGTFTSSITGLTAGTLYHYRAYATNSVGTGYGSDLTFTTPAAGAPTLTTTAASSITNTTAVSGGNISSQGGSSVTARGVCWATTSGPTISGSHTSDGTGIGTFTSNITGLTLGTLYYVRAYATNTSGTAYGNEITFTTTGGAVVICGDWSTIQATGFATAYRGISSIKIVDANTAWAPAYNGSGTGGSYTQEYTKTSNGGTTWTAGKINGYASFSIANITAVSATNAWAALFDTTAGGGKIMVTTNGGTTWTQQTTAAYGSSSWLDFIHFFDANNGVAVGDPNGGYWEIYTTSNGGTTWTRVVTGNIAAIQTGEAGWTGVYSAVGNNIWFGTSTGRVYKSTDKGLHWTAAATGSTDVDEVKFIDANNGIAITKVFNTTSGALTTFSLYKTTNGGTSWTAFTPTGAINTNELAPVPGTTSTWFSVGGVWPYVSGSYGSSYSTDNGATWTAIDATQYTSVSFFNSTTGWAGGFNTDASTGGISKWTPCSSIIPENSSRGTKDILLFPNPAGNEINVLLPYPDGVKVDISIMDIYGKLCKKSVISSNLDNPSKIDLNGLSNGIYLVKGESSQGEFVKKISVIK